MFSKFVKLPFNKVFKGFSPVNSFGFGGQHHPPAPASAKKQEDHRNYQVSHEIPSHVNQDPHKIPNLLDVAHLHYKKYPNAPHNDPHSPEYIHSERDEYADSVRIQAYNATVDGLKNAMKVQQEVYNIIENLDRPYKRGIPGITKNITGGARNYFPPGDLGFKVARERDDDKFFDEHYNNVDRWKNDAIFTPKYYPIESDLEWQKEFENRPVTEKFHHDKGYKYDVAVPWDQRFPHVADRMGYPEILGTPFERLMRLEGEIYHPTYLDQPFVQIPSADPHESLNFEEGEVVYENAKLQEWTKFWSMSGWSLYGFSAFFIPYSLIFKTHMPLPGAFDNMFVPYYTHTVYFFDNWNLSAPLVGCFSFYLTYLAMTLSYSFWKDYVVKLQYSKDKELLFVTRVSPFCSLEEEVFEVQHLEVLPPSVKAGVPHLSSQDDDGLWDITCLASHRNLVVSNEDKYWNTALKKEFFDKVMNLWTKDVVAPSRVEKLDEIINPPFQFEGQFEDSDEGKIEENDVNLLTSDKTN